LCPGGKTDSGTAPGKIRPIDAMPLTNSERLRCQTAGPRRSENEVIN
jgi:hypothetical protein